MSKFNSLKVNELKAIAEFFVVDVVAANPDKPGKAELVAALESGDDPVTWEQYETIFLPAQRTADEPAGPDLTAKKEKSEKPKVIDTSNYVLIKMERRNPRYDIAGLSFTKEHPYHSVDPETAEFIVRNIEGFRLAMPSELADYYN